MTSVAGGDYVITIADTPPSLNAVGMSRGWRAVWKAKKKWEAILADELLVATSQGRGKNRLPTGCTHVHATAYLRFTTARRRDEGNYRALLEKALGDALVLRLVLADDTPEFFTFGELTFDPHVGSVVTTILLRYEV